MHDAAGIGAHRCATWRGSWGSMIHHAAWIVGSMIHHAAGYVRWMIHDAPGGLKPTPAMPGMDRSWGLATSVTSSVMIVASAHNAAT
jgi:hypothetical protein